MILYINSSKKEEFVLGLYKHDKLKYQIIKSVAGTMSEKFLSKLDSFLSNNNLTIKNLTAIMVFPGPGSYTSLRIGISIANALAWSLNIPIFGTKTKNLRLKTKSFSLKLKRETGFNKPIKPYYSNKI